MARKIDADELVALPNMDAAEARALAASLLTAGKKAKKDLSGSAKRALSRIKSTAKKLGESVQAAAGAGRSAVRQADVAEDAAWSALYSWLTGFSKLPEGIAERAKADTLLGALFPDRLHFTHLPFKAEWTAVQDRVLKLEQGLSKTIESLGGKPFLEAIRTAHAEYGKTLGTTSEVPLDPKADGKTVREPLTELQSEIRDYVVKVTALVEPGKAATTKLAKKLLRPLTEWKPTDRRASPEPAPAPRAPKPT
jgi:hypothetical protein